MAFTGFSKAALIEKYPAMVGRSGKPNVAIAGNGRLQFSSEATKAFLGCTVLIPSFDPTRNMLRFDGFVKAPDGKEDKTWLIVWPKPPKGGKKGAKNKQASLAGTLILKEVGYDYKAAGNQNFDIEKMDVEKHVVVFVLPKETPKPRAKVERKKKVKAPATGIAAVAAGVPAAQTANGKAAPDDDIVLDT